ncbi:MAG: glycosyltransferase family 87 protein [Chloroflexota bacterium]
MDRSIRETLPPQRLLHISAWLMLILLIGPLYLRIALVDPVDFQQGGLGAADFKAYYVAARLLGEGQVIYDIGLQSAENARLGLTPDDTFYVYPPLLALLMTPPASSLSLAEAAVVWNTFNFVLLMAIVLLVSALFGLRRRLGDTFPWFVLLFALAVPTFEGLRIGQANILTLFLVLAALYAERRGRSSLAAVALAFAFLLKLFPAVLLLWFAWRREWRPLLVWGVTVGVVLLLSAVSYVIFGVGANLDLYYALYVLPNLSAPQPLDNQSLAGVLTRAAPGAPLRTVILATASLLIVAVTLFGFARAARPRRFLLAAAILLNASLLVVTITWTTTLVFLLISFAVLLTEERFLGRPPVAAAVLFMAYGLLSGTRILAMSGIPFAHHPILSSLPFFSSLLLWGALAVLAITTPRAPLRNEPR